MPRQSRLKRKYARRYQHCYYRAWFGARYRQKQQKKWRKYYALKFKSWYWNLSTAQKIKYSDIFITTEAYLAILAGNYHEQVVQLTIDKYYKLFKHWSGSLHSPVIVDPYVGAHRDSIHAECELRLDPVLFFVGTLPDKNVSILH